MTTLANGDRPPVGAIVHSSNGRDYLVIANPGGVGGVSGLDIGLTSANRAAAQATTANRSSSTSSSAPASSSSASSGSSSTGAASTGTNASSARWTASDQEHFMNLNSTTSILAANWYARNISHALIAFETAAANNNVQGMTAAQRSLAYTRYRAGIATLADLLDLYPDPEERHTFVRNAYAAGNIHASDIIFGPSLGGIRIDGDSSQQDIIRSNMQLLTDHSLVVDNLGMVGYLNYLPNNPRLPVGTELVRTLITHEFRTSIRIDPTGSHQAPDRGHGDRPYDGTGFPSRVYFAPNRQSYMWTIVNPTTGYVSRELTPTPLHIILAHELIHSERTVRGDSERKTITIVGNRLPNNEHFTSTIIDSFGNLTTVTDFVSIEDLMTVGLHANSNHITENMIRAEHGLRLRGRYK